MQNLLKGGAARITLAALLFVSITVISERLLRPLQLDVTEDGLYTLSDGTRAIVNRLEEPISIDLFFSETLAAPYPTLLAYGQRVRDLLEAIARASGGRVELRLIDPEPFSEEEDRAVAAGLQGVPLPAGETLYLGIVARDRLEGQTTLPFMAQERERFLEYDIAKLITTLEAPARPRIGLISRLPLRFGAAGPQAALQGLAEPYVVYEQLEEVFEIETLDADFGALPASLSALVILHPPALSEDQQFLIDQYLLGGGKALILLDPHAEASGSQTGRFTPDSSADALKPLLDAWGLTLDAGQLVADRSLAQRVQVGAQGQSSIKDFVLWLNARGPVLATGDAATANIDSINIATAGVIATADQTETEDEETDAAALVQARARVEPLITSSPDAMLLPVATGVGEPDPDALLRQFEPAGEAYTLMARLSGEVGTAFPKRAAEIEGGLQRGPLTVVLGADSDMAADRFWVQTQRLFGERLIVPIAGNGSLIVNLVDQLAGDAALIGLRGRGVTRRPFEVVDRLRRQAEGRYLAEEQALEDRLTATQARLDALAAEQPEGAQLLSSEQEAEVARFRAELVNTRRALRDVQGGLRRDVQALGTRLAILNILAVPVLVVLLGLGLSWRRRARRQEERAQRGFGEPV